MEKKKEKENPHTDCRQNKVLFHSLGCNFTFLSLVIPHPRRQMIIPEAWKFSGTEPGLSGMCIEGDAPVCLRVDFWSLNNSLTTLLSSIQLCKTFTTVNRDASFSLSFLFCKSLHVRNSPPLRINWINFND